MLQAFKKLGISPGKFTEEFADKRLAVRMKNSEKSNLPATKLLRYRRKLERATIQSAQEACEGDTYESGKY